MTEMEQIAASLTLSNAFIEKNGSWWIESPSLDVRLMAAVMRSHEARFVTLTAMQLHPPEPIRLDYHWDLQGKLLTFTTAAQRNQIASIVDLCAAADWIERETHENFSIEFAGRDYKPLLLRLGDVPGLQFRAGEPL
jgi:NADH:ubiquinone oxidoreductase subunit C